MLYITISGIDETIDNINTIHNRVNNNIIQEINKIGTDILEDLKDITPVVTGRLQKSAFFENGDGMNDLDSLFMNATLGYSAPYAAEVELRHGMLSQTLYKWNEQIKQRIMMAGLDAVEDIGSGSKSIEQQAYGSDIDE